MSSADIVPSALPANQTDAFQRRLSTVNAELELVKAEGTLSRDQGRSSFLLILIYLLNQTN